MESEPGSMFQSMWEMKLMLISEKERSNKVGVEKLRLYA